MADTKKLGEVFKTVGLPPYTYVKPTYNGEVQADIEQPGKHVLIEGPSGVGKTCIIFKIFEEMSWTQGTQFQYISCRDTDAEDKVNAFFRVASEGKLPEPPLIVIDDFHLLLTQRRADIGSSLKRLSDRAFEQASPPKVVLIGIPTTGLSLLSEAYDLGPRLGTYKLNRASDQEIDRLISEGETTLNVLFEDRDSLLGESGGASLPSVATPNAKLAARLAGGSGWGGLGLTRQGLAQSALHHRRDAPRSRHHHQQPLPPARLLHTHRGDEAQRGVEPPPAPRGVDGPGNCPPGARGRSPEGPACGGPESG